MSIWNILEYWNVGDNVITWIYSFGAFFLINLLWDHAEANLTLHILRMLGVRFYFYQRHRLEKLDSAGVNCATEMANLPFYHLHTLVACCLCHLVSSAGFLMPAAGFYMTVIGSVISVLMFWTSSEYFQ